MIEVEDWAMAKLLPKRTGLPMSVWITQKDGYPHDVRVKVSALHGGRGSWNLVASVSVRPLIREVSGSLTTQDFSLISQWIELNNDVIIDYWDDNIDIYETLSRLLPL